jgi:hypothetical protein
VPLDRRSLKWLDWFEKRRRAGRRVRWLRQVDVVIESGKYRHDGAQGAERIRTWSGLRLGDSRSRGRKEKSGHAQRRYQVHPSAHRTLLLSYPVMEDPTVAGVTAAAMQFSCGRLHQHVHDAPVTDDLVGSHLFHRHVLVEAAVVLVESCIGLG